MAPIAVAAGLHCYQFMRDISLDSALPVVILDHHPAIGRQLHFQITHVSFDGLENGLAFLVGLGVRIFEQPSHLRFALLVPDLHVGIADKPVLAQLRQVFVAHL